jgi:hypothetical protein
VSDKLFDVEKFRHQPPTRRLLHVLLTAEDARKATAKANKEERQVDEWGCAPKLGPKPGHRDFRKTREGSEHAEAAVARFLGIPWPNNPRNYWDTDVGPYYVRSVKWRNHHNGRMLLHEPPPVSKDFPAGITILARPMMENYMKWDIRGWAWNHEGQNPAYWKTLPGDDRACYVVPHEALRPMDDLPGQNEVWALLKNNHPIP